MAVSRTFQAIITVLDRTAGPLRVIQARLRGLAPATLTVGQNLALVRDRLVALGQNPALQRVGAAMAGVGRRAMGLVGAMGRVGLGLAGLAAGAGVTAGGLVAMARATVDSAGQLVDLSNRLGTSVEDLQALRHAFSQGGVEAETLTSALERLQKGVAEAAAGQNKDLAELFQRMGIALRDSNGQIRSAAEIMPQLAQAFEQNGNAAVRTRMAMALFGRSGAPLIAVLQGGSAALREQMDRWRELDGQITNDVAPSLDEVGDRMAEVQVALTGVRNAIVVRLAPALAPLLERLATWIAANRDIIATNVAEWVTRVATAVSEWDIAGFIARMERFATAVGDVVDRLGGFENVLMILGGLALAPLVASLVSLGTALVGLAAAAGAFTPVGAVVVGLTALAAAGTALYNGWKPFRDIVDGLVDGLRALASSALPRGEAPGAPQQNFQDRARLGGFYGEPMRDPDTGELAFPNAVPRTGPLLRRQSAPGGAAPAGRVDVNVSFDDLPRGARVEATTTGAVAPPRLDVGYARMGAE